MAHRYENEHSIYTKKSYNTYDEIETIEFYNEQDQLHNIGDKPAIITYYPTGQIKKEEYFKNGEIYRNGNKPAIIEYFSSGKIEIEQYISNGQFSRTNNKPAVIEYFENGNILLEVFFTSDGKIQKQIEYSQCGDSETHIEFDSDENESSREEIFCMYKAAR